MSEDHQPPWQTLRARIMLAALMFLCVLSLPSVTELRLSNDFRVYFSETNPELSAYEQFEEDFTSHDSLVLMVLLNAPDQSWLMPKYHPLIEEMEAAIWQLPTIHRVNALSNYQYTQAEGDTITVTPFLELMTTLLPADANKETIERQVLPLMTVDPQLNEVYLSNDQQLLVIQADLYLDKATPDQARNVYQQADELRQAWQQQYPSLTFYLVGSVASNVTLEEAVANDLKLLVPITYLVIVFGLWFFLRSLVATGITLVVVTLSIIFTFSLFALFKQELTPVAGFVPSIVLTLAVADCVHYLTTYRYLMTTESYPASAANREAYRINWLPITITSFTTAFGVLFLNLSDSPPYQDLGNMVAIGVLLAWAFTLLIVPMLLDRFPLEYAAKSTESGMEHPPELLEKYSVWLRGNSQKVFLFLLLVVSMSVYGLTKLYISENWSKYFSEEFELTQAINLVKDKFNRLHRYELVLRSDSENGVNELEYLQAMDDLLGYLEENSQVKQIQSYAYILKRLNQTMHNDAPDKFTLPDSTAMAAQYLLLYELSLPQGLGMENFVTFNKSASRTTVLLTPSDSSQLLKFEEELLSYFQVAKERLDHNLTLEISGLDHIFAHIAERNIMQMLFGTTVALLVISVLLSFIFKSIKYGVISLIPNLIPGVIAYGIWGATAGYIDLALSVVICMSLGIIVDDSVHFLSKYIRARRELGLSTAASIDYSFHVVGKALVTTTVILVAGFSTLLISPLQPTSATGALLSITLVMALVVDFTLLPLVLNHADKDDKSPKPEILPTPQAN
ncbi:MAG: MMPL family transporter [Enterobacterales bacterium]|nr:MMPL family transporter [Enterobacterales bacterium]